MKGGRKASKWNLFTKKVFEEGRRSDPDYSFKQALKDASNRKEEMNSSSSMSVGTKKSFKKSNGKTKKGGKRRNRSSRRRN